jgi:hypothetical protein
MRILYSYNKSDYEARYWHQEIASASTDDVVFLPFNHGTYLDPKKYVRAQLLDNLYYEGVSLLLKMYSDLQDTISAERIDVLLVDNCAPYHPEFLRKLNLYKVLRTSDGPLAAYDRDFPYCHAYDHVLYHSRAYSNELTMPEKLSYIGVRRADFWPMCVFDAMRDT